jgi:2'-5' RNA ligase
MDLGKYFMALVLPEPLQNQVMTLKHYVRDHFDSKAALRSPAHITLHMPFEWKLKKEELLTETLHKFKFPTPVHVQLRNFNCFEPRVVYVDVLPCAELRDLQKALVTHVRQNLGLMNEAENVRGFHPHATIAFRDLNKEKFRQTWEHFKTQKFEGHFTTSKFQLLKHSPGKWEVFEEFIFSDR